MFEAGGVRFSTPICFEDTFPGLCREFIRRGAQVLVNMTNDSWSKSVACEMQHMSIALFRAVENRRTLVRATNGGITCVDRPQRPHHGPCCRRSARASWSPRRRCTTGASTLYNRLGDWFPFAALAVGLGLPAGGLLRLAPGRRRGTRAAGLTIDPAWARMAYR